MTSSPSHAQNRLQGAEIENIFSMCLNVVVVVVCRQLPIQLVLTLELELVTRVVNIS